MEVYAIKKTGDGGARYRLAKHEPLANAEVVLADDIKRLVRREHHIIHKGYWLAEMPHNAESTGRDGGLTIERREDLVLCVAYRDLTDSKDYLVVVRGHHIHLPALSNIEQMVVPGKV